MTESPNEVFGATNPGQRNGSADPWANFVEPGDLRAKATRGALVSTITQVAMLTLRTGSLMVLARLLLKEDFGLVNMVTAFTGFLTLFRDAGLSMATVQRPLITKAQASTLFWVNLAVGVGLTLLSLIAAPVLVIFYREPRLLWITATLGITFLLNGTSAQHRALLQRNMQFPTLAIIDGLSIIAGITAAIVVALAGYRYWALVAMTIAQPMVTLPGLWLATGWVPGMPRRGTGIRSVVMYGGAVTLNNLVVYLAFNADKILIGRFWGAEALGSYGRAYQLINLPTENLNSAIGAVALPALSRVQNDPVRLKAFFLKGYSLFLSLVMPITVGCALFADDIISILLGPKWHDSVIIFRLLTPTILGFGCVNTFEWLLQACGQVGRLLKIGLAVMPALILSYVLGLQHGPQGVAIGFSTTVVLAAVPIIFWARAGTLIAMGDVVKAAAPSVTSVALGIAAVIAMHPLVVRVGHPFTRLGTEASILFAVYLVTLLFVMRQKSLYVGLLRDTGLIKPIGSRAVLGRA
jgi:PST family polysaccharide transporter